MSISIREALKRLHLADEAELRTRILSHPTFLAAWAEFRDDFLWADDNALPNQSDGLSGHVFLKTVTPAVLRELADPTDYYVETDNSNNSKPPGHFTLLSDYYVRFILRVLPALAAPPDGIFHAALHSSSSSSSAVGNTGHARDAQDCVEALGYLVHVLRNQYRPGNVGNLSRWLQARAPASRHPAKARAFGLTRMMVEKSSDERAQLMEKYGLADGAVAARAASTPAHATGHVGSVLRVDLRPYLPSSPAATLSTPPSPAAAQAQLAAAWQAPRLLGRMGDWAAYGRQHHQQPQPQQQREQHQQYQQHQEQYQQQGQQRRQEQGQHDPHRHHHRRSTIDITSCPTTTTTSPTTASPRLRLKRSCSASTPPPLHTFPAPKRPRTDSAAAFNNNNNNNTNSSITTPMTPPAPPPPMQQNLFLPRPSAGEVAASSRSLPPRLTMLLGQVHVARRAYERLEAEAEAAAVRGAEEAAAGRIRERLEVWKGRCERGMGELMEGAAESGDWEGVWAGLEEVKLEPGGQRGVR